MTPERLIREVRSLVVRPMPAPQAAATLCALLAAFGAERSNHRVPETAAPCGGYARLLLNHPNDSFQVILVPWLPGHESPIHDHAGVVGAVTALAGATTETRYRVLSDDGTHARLAMAGCVCMRPGLVMPLGPEDGQQVHAMSHADGNPAVTLHVYLKPLHAYNTYEPMPGGYHRRHARALWVDETEAWRRWPHLRRIDERRPQALVVV